MKKTLLLSFILIFSFNLFSQIPAGYYDSANGLSGETLKNALHNIIKNHTECSYDDLRDFILENTDKDPNNSNNVILLYTGRSQAASTFGGGANDWNREHVWAKSHGDFGTNPPAGTDAHHIRPTDDSVNSTRGNLDFDNGGNPVSEAPGCYYDSDSWEPRDAVKGDVARMMFYMAVRYEGDNGEPDLELVDYIPSAPNGTEPFFGKLSTLLQWNHDDPVDSFEENRNNIIYNNYQHNRNPFIDHPEWADSIWNPSTSSDIIRYNENKFFNIYPVPAKNEITIFSKNSFTGNLNINFTDLLGKKVKELNIEGYNKIMKVNISDLQSGIYFVKIIEENVQQITKIVVE